jgi:hypothetical protein
MYGSKTAVVVPVSVGGYGVLKAKGIPSNQALKRSFVTGIRIEIAQ